MPLASFAAGLCLFKDRCRFAPAHRATAINEGMLLYAVQRLHRSVLLRQHHLAAGAAHQWPEHEQDDSEHLLRRDPLHSLHRVAGLLWISMMIGAATTMRRSPPGRRPGLQQRIPECGHNDAGRLPDDVVQVEDDRTTLRWHSGLPILVLS